MSAAAIISITLTTSSPTIQLSGSDEDDPFYLITTATIKSNTNPSSPITLHTGRYPVGATALATHAPWERGLVPLEASPALRGHAIKALSLEQTSGSEARKKTVDWDYFRTQAIPPPNLREDETFTWATVPVEGELSVRHFLPREKLRECGVCVGEVYTTALDPQVSSACSLWWTWGDLETDLKCKKFGYKGRKDGRGGIVREGDEWAVNKSVRGGRKLMLEHSDEVVQIRVV